MIAQYFMSFIFLFLCILNLNLRTFATGLVKLYQVWKYVNEKKKVDMIYYDVVSKYLQG